MEILRRHVASQPTRFAAYIALQCALMRRFLARGGTYEEYCARLAPVFHRRFGPALLVEPALLAALPPCSPRVRQECPRSGAQTDPPHDRFRDCA